MRLFFIFSSPRHFFRIGVFRIILEYPFLLYKRVKINIELYKIKKM